MQYLDHHLVKIQQLKHRRSLKQFLGRVSAGFHHCRASSSVVVVVVVDIATVVVVVVVVIAMVVVVVVVVIAMVVVVCHNDGRGNGNMRH